MGCRSPRTAEELGLLLPAAGGELDGGPGNDHCIETCGNFLPVRRADRVTCMPDATRLTHHMVFTRLYTPTISPFPGHMGPLVAGVVKPVGLLIRWNLGLPTPVKTFTSGEEAHSASGCVVKCKIIHK